MIVGHIEDNGILVGLIKLAGEGGIPYELFRPGTEKSSMPSFKMIPVCCETILQPNLKETKWFERKFQLMPKFHISKVHTHY